MAKKQAPSKSFPSRSYIRFEEVIERSLHLADLRQPLEEVFNKTRNPHDLSDMTRAAVALGVAAMDAYFTGVFAEYFISYLKKQRNPPKKLVELLEEAGLNAGTALELLTMQRPYRRVRKLMDAYLAIHVTQRFDVIDELFAAYGFRDFCKQIQGRSRRKTLLSSVNILVKRRHEIVHKGDVNSKGTLQNIESEEIKKRILDVVKLVSTADELIQRKMAK